MAAHDWDIPRSNPWTVHRAKRDVSRDRRLVVLGVCVGFTFVCATQLGQDAGWWAAFGGGVLAAFVVWLSGDRTDG